MKGMVFNAAKTLISRPVSFNKGVSKGVKGSVLDKGVGKGVGS
jgi:hypothetical protein